MKAAFLYTWDEKGERPSRYTPELTAGLDNVALDTAMMEWCGFDRVIASYWSGETNLTRILEDSRLPVVPLFEREAYEPALSEKELQAEVDWLWRGCYLLDATNNWAGGAYPLLYVYNHWPVAAEVVEKWRRVNADRFQLVMRSGPNDKTLDAWPGVMQYGYEPTGRGFRIPGHSVQFSPGFWKPGEPEVLPRDLWQFGWCATMARWCEENLGEDVYVTTWNEWPEGPGIAPTSAVGGFGFVYMKVLREAWAS
jgi:hypothetical protein